MRPRAVQSCQTCRRPGHNSRSCDGRIESTRRPPNFGSMSVALRRDPMTDEERKRWHGVPPSKVIVPPRRGDW